MPPSGGRRIKSESVKCGLITPARTLTPKVEIDLTESDSSEELAQLPQFKSPVRLSVEDEGYASRVAERQPSLSLRPSSQPQSQSQQTSFMAPIESGLEVVGRDVNKLIETIEKLKRIGLKSISTVLPELVLVGDQSAGKSSLMGAIAEIHLPKGASMCTRCPTNIKTSAADEWTCSVSLSISYTYDPVKRSSQAFPNWADSDELVIHPFVVIDDKNGLEEVIKAAQTALLNPHQDFESFVPSAVDFSRNPAWPKRLVDEAKFSPNVISVEISGPGLPELSLYDLPGLFQAAEDTESQYLVGVFESLTRKYIMHENALIICAITMQNDPHLSRTKALIGDCKAEDRCIGVLTMPDRMQSESAHRDYSKIFKGLTYKLKHGYFVCKQPGNDSQAKGPGYHQIARREEREYFENSPLWGPDGEWYEHRRVCGTNTIQQYLSKEFARQILESLPDITNKIYEQTVEVDRELALLPDDPQDRVQHIVRQELTEFSTQIRQLLDDNSSSGSNAFRKPWKTLCDQFLEATKVMRPACNFKAKSDAVPVDVINLDDDDDVPQQNGKRPRERGEDSPQNKRLKVDNEPSIFNRVKQESPTGAPTRTPRKKPLPEGIVKNRHLFGPFYQDYLAFGSGALSITDIRTDMADNTAAGKPDNVNFKVREEYALVSVGAWNGPLATFIDCTFQVLRHEVLRVLEEVLVKYKHTPLFRDSKKILEKFLDQREKQQRALSMDFYAVEKGGLFTISKDVFDRYKGEALQHLTTQRRKHRVECHYKRQLNRGLKIKDEESWKANVTDEQLGPDPFAKELETAAYVRGYYTTARIRFTDSVCLNMNVKYFGAIKSDIRYLLERALHLDENESEKRCQNLLETNADIGKQRNTLLKRKQQLQEFSDVLDQLQRDISKPDDDEEMDFQHSPLRNGNGDYRPESALDGHGDSHMGDESELTSNTVSPQRRSNFPGGEI